MSVKVPFTIKWDRVVTGNLNFYLHFNVPQAGTFKLGSGVIGDSLSAYALVTILDKDHAPTLRVRDTAMMEGNTGAKVFPFVVSFADSVTGGTYSGTVNRDITYTWHTVDGTAKSSDNDYIAVPAGSGKGIIKKGATTDTIRVSVIGDYRYEPDESFNVVIDSASLVGQAAVSAGAQKKFVGIGTILNDDSMPQLALSDTGYFEGNADSTRYLRVYLVDPSRIDPVTNKPVRLDTSSAPEVPVKYTWYTNDGTAGHTLTPTAPDTVKDTDYIAVGATKDSVKAYRWTDTIQVKTKGDLRYEPDETFKVTLIPGDSAYKKNGNTVATDTIRNDDNQPVVQVTVDSIKGFHEGKSGDRHVATFTVTLRSQAPGNPLMNASDIPTGGVSFNWSTVNGTAIGRAIGSADSDYVPVTSAKKVLTKVTDTLQVVIIGDNKYEKDENFLVKIDSASLTNAAAANANNVLSASAIILNDDSLPRLKVVADSSFGVHEGASGQHPLESFTVFLTDSNGAALSLADAPEVPVSFTWSTSDGIGANAAKSSGTGVADTDFVAVPATSVTIDSGKVSTKLVVKINGDGIYEGDESFGVNVNPGTNAARTGPLSVNGIIIDDDKPPTLKLTGVVQSEGTGTNPSFNFGAKLSYAPSLPTTIWWHTVDGTATVADGDYQPKGVSKDTASVISAGSDSIALPVIVIGDSKLEPDEYFSIKVDSVKVGTLLDTFYTILNGFRKDTAVGTILNDDGHPAIRIDPLVIGNEGTGITKDTLKFVVALVDSASGKDLAVAPALNISYSWQTQDGTGDTAALVSDNDYVGQATPLARTIVAGKTKDTIAIPLTPDSKYELNEWFRVILSSVTNATTTSLYSNLVGKGVILNDDNPPTLSVTGDTVTEPVDASAPDSNLVFTYTLSAPSGIPVTFTATTYDETTTEDDTVAGIKNDYRPWSHVVTIPAGQTAVTDFVKVHGDNVVEGTETMRVKISSIATSGSKGASATLASDSLSKKGALGVILDQDPPPYLYIDTAKVNEGATAPFHVTLRDSLGNLVTCSKTITFNWTTRSGTALAGLDFDSAASTGTILAGQSSAMVNPVVQTRSDNVANEGIETFTVVLSNQNVGKIHNVGLGQIVDKTAKSTVSINDTFDLETADSLHFTVHLDNPSAIPLNLVVNTSKDGDIADSKLQARDSSATNPVYYNYKKLVAVPVTIPAGATSVSVSVPLHHDGILDPDTLYFWNVLSKKFANDTAFSFGKNLSTDSIGVGKIVNIDPPPSISVNDTSVREPADATSPAAWAHITFRLSSPAAQIITVKWGTADSTAHDSDYVAKSGAVIFNPGDTAVVDSVQVLADSIWEGPEYFKVLLSSQTPATTPILKGTGIVTILDNDVAPALWIDDAVQTEPSAPDSLAMLFKVHLSHVSGLPVNFTWQTADSTGGAAVNEATAGIDYRAVGPTAVTIMPGDSTVTLPVWIYGDAVAEQTEAFKVLLSKTLAGDTNFTFRDSLAIGNIQDGNGRPFLSIDTLKETEKDTVVHFTLKLSMQSSSAVRVYLHTRDGSATAGSDYVALPDSGKDTVVTIPAYTSSASFPVHILDDQIQEHDETFFVVIDSTDSITDAGKRLPSANIFDSIGVDTIVDNDAAPAISINDTLVQEPAKAGDSTTITFTVRLSSRSALPIKVQWQTVDSTAQSIEAPVDYKADGNTLKFEPSDTVKTISITVYGDSLYEGSEVFKVRLFSPSNVSLAKDSVGIGTILDNDTAPVISISSPVVKEGDTAVFTVRLNRPSGLPVVFDWESAQIDTAYGHATIGKDFLYASGHADTIQPGKLTVTVTPKVPTLADTITGEGTETFHLLLHKLLNATGDSVGTGTILDTNTLPGIFIDSVGPLTEGKDTAAVFTVTLKGGVSAVPVTVWYHTQDGTAEAGKRYVATSGTVTIPAGQSFVRLSVKLLNDTIREALPQTFTVLLDSTDSAFIKQSIGLATIIDTGDFPHLVVGNSDTVSEGNPAVFPVTLRGATLDTVKVYWHTVPGDLIPGAVNPARADSDFVSDSGVAILRPLHGTTSIAVTTLSDSVWEPTEVFGIKIDSIIGADTAKNRALLSPTDSIAKAWIKDVGGIPTVQFLTPDTSISEGDSVRIVVGLSRPASIPVQVKIPNTPGTATPGLDFVTTLASDTTLTIPAHASSSSFVVKAKKDSLDENDETANWKLIPLTSGITLGPKFEYHLTILDIDSPSVISFVRDTQWIKEGASVNVVAHLNRPSGKDIQAWYRTSGTAAPGVDDDLRPDAHEVFFIKAGDTTASVVVHTVDDSIYEGTETMVFTIDSTVNATKGTPSVDSVFILDNDSVPVVSFVVADTTVKEDVGTVTLRIHLDHPAAAPIHVWIKAHAMPLDATKGIYPATLLSNANKNDTLVSTSNQADVALNGDSTYVVVIPSLDTSVSFSFKVLDDGRVEPTETFRLGITSEEANPKDPDSLQVHILDNDKLPAVKITSPADSAHLGKKNLDGDGKVPVTWTVDGTVQTPYDTLLPEGKSVIRKSYTDIWGNVGTDTITVWLDTTPPTVKIDSISKDGGKTWIAVDTPWVNVPGIIVKWHSIDDGVTTWHQDSTKLTDTLNTISRCFEDAVGNKGCGSGTVGLDTTAPKVWITTPPNGSQWPLGCVGVTYYVQDMGTTTRHDTTYCSDVLGPQTITTPTYTDRAGNTAKGTTSIVMVPNTPSSAKYIDSDGDGRIDEVIVQFPAKVVGNLPSFEISYGTPGTNTISSSSVSYGSSSQAGNYYVVKGDTLRNASGTAVKVVEGRPVVGSDGQQLVDSTGKPVFASTGTPLLDAHGKQVRDTNGIPLWVAASGSAVDSSVLVVKLVPQFPYGWTSSTVTNLGVIKGTNAAVVNGQTVKQSWTDTFDIKDGVAPVIEKSEIHRTESYSGKDTLWIYPSEPLVLKSKDGSGIFQVSLDSGKTWIDVKVSSISSTGALQIILDLGSGVKPGVMVRFGDSVSDAAGNVVNHNTDTTKVVVQGPNRPDLIDVTQPSGVIQVNPSTGNSAQKGGFAFVASTGDTSTASMKTYQPGQGYSNAQQDLCPDYNQCSVTSLYINKPSSVQMYVYDQIGTYIASTRFVITEQDIKTIQKDKLDRTQLKVLWNLRDTKGEQVISGIYLIRFVVRSDNFTTVNGQLENHVIKIGVKVN